MLAVLCCRQVFGGNATKDKVREELMTYSDYSLHAFALGNKKHFQKYVLPQDAVYDSAKCCRLRDMLLELKAKGSRWEMEVSFAVSCAVNVAETEGPAWDMS